MKRMFLKYLCLVVLISTLDRPAPAQVTSIAGSDTLSSSRTVINNNFTYLDTSKFGSGTTTITSGDATHKVTGSATGWLQSVVEGSCQAAGSGNLQAGVCMDLYQGGHKNPADYGNMVGMQVRSQVIYGFNDPANTNKKTMVGALFDTRWNASGQRTGLISAVYSYGIGDAQGMSTQVTTQSYNNAIGDEGNVAMQGAIVFPIALTTITTTGITRTGCGITSLAGGGPDSDGTRAIIKNNASPQIVNVNGSTANCTVGDWLTVDNGVPTAAFTGGNTLAETIQILAKTSSTITAYWQLSHLISAPVAPAAVITASNADMNLSAPKGWGQGQWVVDLTATPYSTGQASVNGTAVTGSGGANWTDNMVGGDSSLIGCISFDANTVSTGYFSSTPARPWYPIQLRTNGTSMTLIWNYFDRYGSSVAAAGNYVIRPCSRIGSLATTYGASSTTISGIVLESNPFAWTSGHSIEQTISPRMTIQHVFNCPVLVETPMGAGAQGNCYDASNIGHVTLGNAYAVQATSLDDGTHAGWRYAFKSETAVTDAHIGLTGKSLTGIAIQMSAVDYQAAIHWQGEDSADIYRGATGTGFHIDAISGKLAIGNLGTGFTGTIGTGNLTGSALFNFPTAGAGTYTLCTTTTGCGTTIGGSTGSVDNAIIRADGTGGSTLQSSTIIIGDDGTLNMENATALRMKDNGGTSRNMISYDAGNNLVFGGTTNVASVAFAASTSAGIAFSQAANTPLYIHDNNRVSVGGNSTNDFFTLLVEDTIHGTTQLWVREGASQSGAAFAVQNSSGTPKFTIDAASGDTVMSGTLKVAGDTTGSGTVTGFGTNSPASTLTAPYTWVKLTSSDGSTVYVPAYK